MTLAASSGSKHYRVGKGDTSSTLVVVDVELFNAMAKIDKDRWKQVLQVAHRRSFDERAKIELGKPPAK